MKKDVKEKVLAILEKKTAEMFPPVKDDDKRFSGRAKKIAAVIEGSDFGCKSESVAELISAVIGEEITIKESMGRQVLVSFAVCVLTENPNSHDYGIGEPFMITGEQTSGHLRMDGTCGNNVPVDRPSAFRPATRKEIEKFYEANQDKILERFIIL